MFAELLLHMVHRLIHPREFLRVDSLAKEIELDHGVFLQLEEHNPRCPIVLLGMEQLLEGWGNRVDNLMRKGGRAGEADSNTVDTELLGLEAQDCPFGGEFVTAGFDTRIPDVL